MNDKYPSQLAERFQIRMPDGLRDKIRESAEANKRSMNTEIIARLEASFAAPDLDIQKAVYKTIDETIERTIEAMLRAGWKRPEE